MDAEFEDHPEPDLERFARAVKQSARRNAALMAAGFIRAFQQRSAAQAPEFRAAAFGAGRFAVPAALDQIVPTFRFGRKTLLERVPGLGKIAPKVVLVVLCHVAISL